jgi:autotransporter passenger strand-loop-strand repeat protein
MAIIVSGFEIIVEPGDVFSGLTAGNGAPYVAIYVSSGGTIIDTEVFNSGVVGLSSGAVAISTTILSGGTEYVFPGGVARDTRVSAGGTEVVNAGGVTIDAQLVGGDQSVYFTGEASGTTITSGFQFVSSGGVAIGTVVGGGAVVSGAEEEEWVLSGGKTIDPTVRAGGVETIRYGGVASGVTVLSGGTLQLYGGASRVGARSLAAAPWSSARIFWRQSSWIIR